MAQTITVRLSDLAVGYLKQASSLMKQPIDRIVEQSLVHSLPPLLEDIPNEYQEEVFPLLQMSDTELMVEAQRSFPIEQWEEYEALLDKKKNHVLSQEEQTLLNHLRYQTDVFELRKAYAVVLLKRRSQRIYDLN